MTDRWYAIEITADPYAVEALEFLFNEINSLGTEVQQFHRRENDPVTVTGYFHELPDESSFNERLSSILRIYDISSDSIRSVERRTVEKTDWLAEWKKHWRPTQVGRFLIVPEWQNMAVTGDGDRIVIRIDPNMAFGTGTHETTQLCLLAIDRNLKPVETFLDVGTGTGILAIAAAKLAGGQTRETLAVDNDPIAVKIARENAKQNAVDGLIELRCEKISDATPEFDFVCANLTLDVIKPILPLLLRKARRVLVLSGVLREQEAELIGDLKHLGVSDPTVNAAGEWISAIVER